MVDSVMDTEQGGSGRVPVAPSEHVGKGRPHPPKGEVA